jgi:4-oxalocrotonate tautomerase
MPLIQVHLLEGRSKEQKRALLEAITKAAQETLGSPISSIRVWITEMPADHLIAAGVIGGSARAVTPPPAPPPP